MDGDKVLIVDDDCRLAAVLSELLETEGYLNVERACNGLEGLEKYKQLRPNLVLMDMDMPVMNGYESSREIKAFDPQANILILTGSPEAVHTKKTVEEGYALVVLRKPLKWVELGQAIRCQCRSNLPA